MTTGDNISRKAVKAEIEKLMSGNITLAERERLEELNTKVSKMTPKKGEWQAYRPGKFSIYAVCSECGYEPKELSNFCPNCGNYNGGV